jgi:hypothetical protein
VLKGRDREDVVEHLLKERRAPGPVTPECLDAERLAAWSDGGLDAADAERVERHVADCGRCQSMAAAFAASEVSESAREGAATGILPPSARWALPLVAAAAVFLMWVFVPRRTALPTPVQQTAETHVDSPALTPAQRLGPVPPASPAAPPPAAEAARPAPARVEAPGPVASPVEAPRSVAPEPPAKDATAPIATSSSALPGNLAAEPLPQEQAGNRDSVDTLNKTNAVESVPVRAEGGRARAAPAPPAAPTPAIAPNVDAVAEIGVSPGPIEFPKATGSTAAPPPRSAAAAARGAGRSSPEAARPQILWRVFPDRRVERSVTGGSSWEAVALDPNVTIVNGAAPSPTVCWLVGRRGVVLRTIDGGRRFDRMDLPDAPDLTTIRAIDELRAVVTTSDGRTYSTVDGGASWRPGTD